MKTYSIVYNSRTGNTAQLAGSIKTLLPAGECVYFGTEDSEAPPAGLIFAGFWTDKGNCDQKTAGYLSRLENSSLFLFGTAGFGGSEAYFQKILSSVQRHLSPTNRVAGCFMCQGRMPASVRRRYETMLEKAPGDPDCLKLLENFDRAMSHPDANDILSLQAAVRKIL